MLPIFFSFVARIALPAGRVLMFIFFGTLASITWLFQFLKLDKLPEPIKMVVKVFFFGVAITIPVFLVEFLLSKAIPLIGLPFFWSSIIYWFLAIALVEEYFKYWAVKHGVLKDKEFDEPVDTMIYMITVALGFAALENILYLFPPAEKVFMFNELLARTATISFFRFVGATFLHALCSGLVGYFLALAICRPKIKIVFVTIGLVIAAFLHGLYNFSIIEIEGPLKLLIPVAILISLTIFITIAFIKLKKMKSVCKI